MPPYDPEKISSQRRVDALVTLAFLGLSGLLLLLPPPVQHQISSGLRGSVLAPFIWTQEALREVRIRAGEVEVLQVQLDSVVATVSSQRTLEEENRRLRSLLELTERAGGGFVSASVVRPGTRGSESMFLLDVGVDDGVRVNHPVVTAEGLVGVVREVGRRTALAMDWTHPDFRVSAMTVDGEVYGIVEIRRGAFREEDRLLLNGVPYHTPLESGVGIVTSGRGAVYPRGILIGTVSELAESEAGWRRSYWVRPAVRTQSATHVLVLTHEEGPDVESLETLWLPGFVFEGLEIGETGIGELEAGELEDPNAPSGDESTDATGGESDP